MNTTRNSMHRSANLLSTIKHYSAVSLALFLGGCNSVPEPINKPAPKPKTEAVLQQPSSGVKITPYQQAAIGRKNLLALQNAQTTADKDPAVFQQLMQNTIVAYNTKRWEDAERYALQAQRIAPSSAESYLYLSRLAKQKGEYNNSSSLAQRGLSYARTDSMHKQLWLLILQNAQIQKNAVAIKQAQTALQSL